MCALRKHKTLVGGCAWHSHERTVYVATTKMSAFTLSSSAALGSVKVRLSLEFLARARTRTAATCETPAPPMPSFRGACVPADGASKRVDRLPRERGRRASPT